MTLAQLKLKIESLIEDNGPDMEVVTTYEGIYRRIGFYCITVETLKGDTNPSVVIDAECY